MQKLRFSFARSLALRNKTLSTSYSALLLALFVSLVLVSTQFYLKAFSQPTYQLATSNSFLLEQAVDPFQRGVELYQMNDLDGALTNLVQARGLQPRSVPVHLYLADVYRRLHRFTEAESELQATILLAPTDNRHTLALAELYLEQGKYQNAIGLYQQILSKSPGQAEALMGLAMSFEGTSDLNAAQDTYRQLIDLHPNTHHARSAQSRLARLAKAQDAQRTNRYFPVDPDLGEAGLGWWNLKAMPLHVYIDDGEDTRGYRSEMRTLIEKALSAWAYASGNMIVFEIDPPSPPEETHWKLLDQGGKVIRRLEKVLADVPNDPVPSSIHIHWTDCLRNGLGLTWTSRLKTSSPVLSKAHIWIATNKMSDGSDLPENISPSSAIVESQERMLEEVITHELGHALGLPHSSNPNDIMCSGIYGLNATDHVEQRQLSYRDARSLAEHYDNFQESGMPGKFLAKLKQTSSGTDNSVSNSSVETAGSASQSSDNNSASSNLTPYLGEEEGNTTDKKEEEEEKPPEEEGTIEKSTKEEPGTTSYDPLKEAMFDFKTHQYDKALSTLNKILAQNPRQPQAHYLKAVVLVKMRQYPQATLEYKEVLKLTPTSQFGRLAEEGLKKISF